MANHQNKSFAIFFPEEATATETLTTATKEIRIAARNTTINGTGAAVATVAPIPVGLIFKISMGTVSTVTLTLASGKTLTFNANADEITLMSLPNDEVVVTTIPAVDAGAAGNVGSVGGTALA